MTQVVPLRVNTLLRALVGAWIVAGLTNPSFAQNAKSRSYAFALTPLEIHDRLSDLNVGDAVPPWSADERKLLANSWQLKQNASAKPAAAGDVLLDVMLF